MSNCNPRDVTSPSATLRRQSQPCRLLVAGVVAVVAFLGGCATLTPFTHEIRQQYALSDSSLKQIQYYISGPMTLQRDLAKGESLALPSHMLKVVNGRRVEEVIIPRRTPGVAVQTNDTMLWISFEQGHFMPFTCTELPGHYQHVKSSYHPSLVNFRGNGQSGVAAGEKVEYDGEWYESAFNGDVPHLLIDLRKLNRLRRNAGTVPGRELRP